ncbi:MAG: hypothetical protein ACHQYQ_12105 [Bacteriovoracales bacterium]
MKFFLLIAIFSSKAFSDACPNYPAKDLSGNYIKEATTYMSVYPSGGNNKFYWCDSSDSSMKCDQVKKLIEGSYYGIPLTLSPNHLQDHFATQAEINNEACAFEDPKKFAFKIFLNGVDSNLYVCQVGFKNHLCATCGGDYMEVHSGNNKVIINGPNSFLNFQKGEITDGYAEVFLNTFSTGSTYFVKYCLDVNNLVQNNTSILGTVNGVLTSTANVDPGAASAYFNLVGLRSSVVHECGGIGQTLLDSVLLVPNTSLHPEATDLLSNLNSAVPGSLIGKNCSWTYIFAETKSGVRSLVRDPLDPLSKEGQMVHTEIEYNIDFLCLNGTTSCNF